MYADFWWIDWQQGETKGNTGQDGRPDGKMNPTVWTAKARVTDSIRRCKQGHGCTNKRGVTFARWGGLGQHRYQHGFSGDVKHLTWANLAYQAYFSATASNVGFGFWSHDIVGPGDDHEVCVCPSSSDPTAPFTLTLPLPTAPLPHRRPPRCPNPRGT